MAKRVSNQTLEQQLAEAQARAAQIRHQISERRRAAEARRKIVVGGTILAAMEDDPALSSQVLALLRRMVTRDLDREAIADLLTPPDNVIHLGQGDSDEQPPPAHAAQPMTA